jgi:parvulin-like peptidyl-prolyl isomerase
MGVALAVVGTCAWAQDLPIRKGQKVVAEVNGEAIMLEALRQEAASARKAVQAGGAVTTEPDRDVLKRMIDARLIVQEARRIGLDTLPEVTRMVDGFAKEALRDTLADAVTRNVTADEREVDRVYQAATREWKISAILCDSENDAKKFQAALTEGKNFSDLAKEFVGEQKARKGEEGVYVKVKDMDPQLGPVVSKMAVGSTSSVVRTKSGFVIMRLEDVRNAESPEEKEDARRTVLTTARLEALKAFDASLRKKYAKVNRDLLRSVDFESPTPGFDALLRDRRVLAEIKGDAPVTVGDLAEQLKYQFYHGTSQAAERKRLNAKKEAVLDGVLHRRLFRKEALRRGLHQTDPYKSKVADYETSVLFGVFLHKVIVPEIKIKEDELREHYNAHMHDYQTPEMVKIRSLAFQSRSDAEGAVEKLRAGAEFQWLADHAKGQAPAQAPGLLSFDGRLIVSDELPEGVRRVSAGAKSGDFRLYAGPEGHYYALAILEVVPAKPQPYEQARQKIGPKIFAEKQKRAVEEYADKLKAVSDVKVYLKS